MKLTKVAKLVKQSGDCRIIDADGAQWVGTNRAKYAVESALHLTPENVLAVLDVPRDKRENIDVQCRSDLGMEALFEPCLRENSDEPMQEDIRVVLRGSEIVIMHGTQTGARIGVYADELDAVDGACMCYRRGECVAVFPDMLCAAVILGIGQDALEQIDDKMRSALTPEVER